MTEASILDEIIDQKRREVRDRSASLSQSELLGSHREEPRGFIRAMRGRISAGRPAVIAEIKKASPSQGVIRQNFDPAAIAADYQQGGATCLSVLTDHNYFQGSNQNLELARNSCILPILRKDFIVDPWQIYESRSIGADCILLIVAALSVSEVADFYDLAMGLGLDVLVEVHNRQELEVALQTPAELIGINNRDLHSFTTRLESTLELLPDIPADRLVVTESGIHSVEDVRLMRDAGVESFLVGEVFMRAERPGQALKEMFEL